MAIVGNQCTDPITRVFSAAEVVGQDESGEHVQVQLLAQWDSPAVWARCALGALCVPAVGDRVLVAGESPDELYVIGHLSAPRPPARVEVPCGAYAERVETESGSQTLRVMSPRHELLFELDPDTGTTRVAIPAGRLELITQDGDLVLKSGATIRLEGNAIELHGRQRLAMAVSRGLAGAATWLRLLPARLQMGGEAIEASVQRAEIQAAETTLRGRKLTTESEHCRFSSVKMELVAETFLERAGNVYRTVRDLVQLQAGRVRTYVSGMSHFRAQRTYISAEEDVHVHGDKIHLG